MRINFGRIRRGNRWMLRSIRRGVSRRPVRRGRRLLGALGLAALGSVLLEKSRREPDNQFNEEFVDYQ